MSNQFFIDDIVSYKNENGEEKRGVIVHIQHASYRGQLTSYTIFSNDIIDGRQRSIKLCAEQMKMIKESEGVGNDDESEYES